MEESMWMLVALSPSRAALEKIARSSGAVRCQITAVKVSDPPAGREVPGRRDPLYLEAAEMVARRGTGSISMLQRVFEIGYNRAARIMEAMALEGVVGAYQGKGVPREVATSPGAFESIA